MLKTILESEYFMTYHASTKHVISIMATLFRSDFDIHVALSR